MHYHSTLKRALDALLAGMLLVLLPPLMVLIALLIRLTLGAPVLFHQQRPGLHGKPYVF